MKIGDIIHAGTILVVLQPQMYNCGAIYVKPGSIVKAADTTREYSNRCRVFRNRKDEDESNWKGVDLADLRLAKENEIDMWNREIYFIESVKTKENA